MGKQIIKIFLASPSNLDEERLAVHNTIHRINTTIGAKLGHQLQLYNWENSIYSDIGKDGQDVINRQIDDNYDVFIGLFWDKIGTPTPRSASGSVEEYERAIQKHTLNPEIIMMMYFKDVDFQNIPEDQTTEIDSLKKRVAEDGILYYQFSNPVDFENLIFDHLSMLLIDYRKRTKITKPVAKDYLLNSTEYFFESKKESCSLAILYKGKVLLTKRSKKLHIGAGLWQLPGGKVEKDESPTITIIREIQEELGISINPNEIMYITNINAPSLGDKKSSITLHLFAYEVSTKIDNFILEDSIEKTKWISLSQINSLSDECLGSTYDLLWHIRRFIYAFSPLKALISFLENTNKRQYPQRIDHYSEETSQVLLSLLDVLGFIKIGDLSSSRSDDTITLNKIFMEWCLTDRSIFEANGHSDWQTNMLLLNSGEQLLDYQKTLFEKHTSLSALISYKLSKVLSYRSVCDLLIFGMINKKRYILLRWDYFAQKFQIPSKGLEKLGGFEKNDSQIAKFVIHERFSDEIIPAFEYNYLNTFSTTHLSAGSMDDINLIRNYDIHLYSLLIKENAAKKVAEVIYSQNMRAKNIMQNVNISKEAHKETVSFIWADFDELMQNQYLYKSKRVQGFAEIVDFIGMEEMNSLSERATDLTPYTEYLETNPLL